MFKAALGMLGACIPPRLLIHHVRETRQHLLLEVGSQGEFPLDFPTFLAAGNVACPDPTFISDEEI